MFRYIDAKHYIIKVSLERSKVPGFSRYPFNIPAVKGLNEIMLHPAVTFFVGENGAGKSTLVEAIATAYGFNPEGGSINFTFSTNQTHSELHNYIKLQKGLKRPSDGYFLRAESFYNLATNIDQLDELPAHSPKLINAYGGKSLHRMSHGESFLALMLNRFGGKGLYILDEPEAAMSPSRLLTMISRIHQLVEQGSQFIISTHSPILMAYPDSCIYMIDDKGINEISYEETDHYIITRQFMNNRRALLNELLKK
jgi:predicted ATPase